MECKCKIPKQNFELDFLLEYISLYLGINDTLFDTNQ